MNDFYSLFSNESLKVEEIGLEGRNVLIDRTIRINDANIYVGEKSRTENSLIFSFEKTQEDSLKLYQRLKNGSSKLETYRLYMYYMPRQLRIQLPNKKVIKNYTREYSETMSKKKNYDIQTVINTQERIKNGSCLYDMSFFVNAIKSETIGRGVKMMKKFRGAALELIKEEILLHPEYINKILYFRGPFFKGTKIKLSIQDAQMLNVFSVPLLFLEWFYNDEEGFKKWLKDNKITILFEGTNGKVMVISGRGKFPEIPMFTPAYIFRYLHILDGKSEEEINQLIEEEPEEVQEEIAEDIATTNEKGVGLDENADLPVGVLGASEPVIKDKSTERSVKDKVLDKVSELKEKTFDNLKGVNLDEVGKIDAMIKDDTPVSKRLEEIDQPEDDDVVHSSIVINDDDGTPMLSVNEDISEIEMNEVNYKVRGPEKDYFEIIEDSTLSEEDKSFELIEHHNYSALKESVETPEIKAMRKKVEKKIGRSIEETIKDIKTHQLDIEEYKHVDPESSYNKSTVHNLGKAYKEKIAEKEMENIISCGKQLTYPIFTTKYEKTDATTREFYGYTLDIEMETHNGVPLSIKLDVPEVRDNKIFIGGSFKYMSMQNLSKPVIKTDENVIITTAYNKSIMELRGKYPDMRVKQAVMTLRAFSNKSRLLKVKTTDELGDFIYKNMVSYNLIHLNRHFTGCVDENMNIDLRGLEIDEKTGLTILGTIGTETVYHNPEKDLVIFKGKEMDSIDFFLATIRSSDPELFDSCIVRSVTTSGINTPYARIMGRSIPVILILCVAIPFKELLDKMKEENNLEYKVVKNGDPKIDKLKNSEKYGIIRLENYTIVLKYNNPLNEILFNFLTEFDLSHYDTFDITNIMEDFTGNSNTALYIENFIDMFIDPETKRVCQMYNIPDDFVGIFIYAVSLFTSYKTTRKSDISNYRLITTEEIINRCIYDVISKELSDNAARVKRGSRPRINIPRDALIKKIQSLPTVAEANALSPFRVISANSEVSLKGHMGLNEARAFRDDVRAFNPNNLGAETTATSYSGTAGITKHVPFNPTLNDLTGSYESGLKASELNPSNLSSFAESYIYGSKHDHIVRRLMMSGQVEHIKPVVGAEPMLISSYADEVAAYQTPEFAYVAKDKGKIISVNDNFVTVQYEDKTIDTIRLHNVNRNSDKGYYLKNDFILDPKYKVGSSFKKGDIIAYNDNFYKRKPDGNLGLCAGKLVWVLFCDGEGVWEDSTMPFSDLAEALSTKLVKRVARVIDLNTEIRDYVTDIGKDVEPADILFKYKMLTDDDTINELYSNTESLSLKEVDAHSRGKLVDIRVYYRTSKTVNMSSSVKNFIKAVDDVQRVKCNMTDLDKVTDKFNKIYQSSRPQELTKDKYSKINGDRIENGQMLVEYMIETLDKLGPADKIVTHSALKGEPTVVLDKSLRPVGAESGKTCSLMVSSLGFLARMTHGMTMSGLLTSALLDIACESRYLLDIPAEKGTLLDYISNRDILEKKI